MFISRNQLLKTKTKQVKIHFIRNNTPEMSHSQLIQLSIYSQEKKKKSQIKENYHYFTVFQCKKSSPPTPLQEFTSTHLKIFSSIINFKLKKACTDGILIGPITSKA